MKEEGEMVEKLVHWDKLVTQDRVDLVAQGLLHVQAVKEIVPAKNVSDFWADNLDASKFFLERQFAGSSSGSWAQYIRSPKLLSKQAEIIRVEIVKRGCPLGTLMGDKKTNLPILNAIHDDLMSGVIKVEDPKNLEDPTILAMRALMAIRLFLISEGR